MPLPLRRARRRARTSAGAILVEVVIALLLVTLGVTSIVGTLLESSGQKSRIQDKEQGTLYINKLLNGLGNYVTADTNYALDTAMAPNCCWNLVAIGTTACGNPGNCPAGYALDSASSDPSPACSGKNPGCHDATFAFLKPCAGGVPPPCSGGLYNSTLVYQVTKDPVTGILSTQATLTWSEP